MAEDLLTIKRCPCTWLWPPHGWTGHIPACREPRKDEEPACSDYGQLVPREHRHNERGTDVSSKP